MNRQKQDSTNEIAQRLSVQASLNPERRLPLPHTNVTHQRRLRSANDLLIRRAYARLAFGRNQICGKFEVHPEPWRVSYAASRLRAVVS